MFPRSVLLFFLFAIARAGAADFTVVNTAGTGPGSLSEAILAANALSGLDRIVFNIPGPGPHKIKLTPDGLPNITSPVIIDGYTQPGASANTLTDGDNAVITIQIDGAYDEGPGIDHAIVITAGAGGSTIRGLSITGLPSLEYDGSGFPAGGAIQIALDNGNTIEGNFLGIEPDGTSARGTPVGVRVGTNGNTLGGTSPASRNVIGGNHIGVFLLGTHDNKVAGNFIGTDASGTQMAANVVGVLVRSGDHVNTIIGGTAPGARNVISGQIVGPGIQLGLPDSPANDVVVAGNVIGRAVNGVDPLHNDTGVLIFGSRNVIGGLDPAAGNLIASNATAGVQVKDASENFTSLGNSILSNTFYQNLRGDIDLGGDGRKSNDIGDGDTGPNNLQNFPIITAIDPPAANGDLTIHGELDSLPSSGFLLQFFSSVYPEGPRLLGNLSVTTNATGRVHFDFVAPAYGTPKYATLFESTATDSAGNTSEVGSFPGWGQLANISTRADIQTGDNILIAGFVVHSHQPLKKVIIRALGPSLNVPKRLTDPSLELYDQQGALLAKNDDWRSSQQQVMETGIPPSSDLESAIVASLPDGSYTALVRGVNGVTGIGVVEVYDLDPLSSASNLAQLVNLSTRGLVGQGDNALIGGLIIRGDGPQNVVIRAIGPDLIAAGLPAALPDPILELRDGSGTLLAANDNWRDTQEEEIGQSQLAPNDNRDSAIAIRLAPGPYTAIVRGKNATGLGLVEVFALPPSVPPFD